MRHLEILSCRELRDGLAATLRRVQDGSPVFVGSHRQPQAVVLSVRRYEELLEAFERGEAVAEAVASVRAEGLEPTAHARELLAAVAGGSLDEEQAVASLRRRYLERDLG